MELIYHSSGMSEVNQCLGDPIYKNKRRISSGKCADQQLPPFVEINYMDFFDVIASIKSMESMECMYENVSRTVTFSGIRRNTQM